LMFWRLLFFALALSHDPCFSSELWETTFRVCTLWVVLVSVTCFVQVLFNSFGSPVICLPRFAKETRYEFRIYVDSRVYPCLSLNYLFWLIQVDPNPFYRNENETCE
jgi:hypothetical protein